MLKALLKVRLAAFAAYFTGTSRSRKQQSKTKKLGMLALMLYCAAAFGMLFYSVFQALAGAYSALGLDWLYFAMYAVMAFALMVLGSVFTAKAELFEAKDNELLLSMPIAPRAILASRMVSLLLLNLLLGLLTAIPALLAWGQAAALPVLGWVSFFLLLPSLACFSLAVTGLLAWLLSLLAGRVRRKALVTVLGSAVFLGAYLSVVMRLSTYMQVLAENGAAIAETLSGAKVLVWLGQAMAGEGVEPTALSLLATLVPFAALYVVLSRSFLRIVTTKRAFAKIRYEEKTLKTASPDRALFGRELRRLGASPTYLLNSGMGVLFLLAGAVALVVKRDSICRLAAEFAELRETIPVLLALGICSIASMALFTPSSVSLEGKTLWILQSTPVSGVQILNAKLRMANLLMLPAALLAGVCCAFVTDKWLFAALTGVLFACCANLFGLRQGILHARLDWSNEAQVVKQSWAVVITMFASWAVVLAAGALWLLWLAELVSAEAFLLGFSAVLAVINALLLRWLKTRGAERFSALS